MSLLSSLLVDSGNAERIAAVLPAGDAGVRDLRKRSARASHAGLLPLLSNSRTGAPAIARGEDNAVGADVPARVRARSASSHARLSEMSDHASAARLAGGHSPL